MTHNPERPSRTSWFLKVCDPDRRSRTTAPMPRWEEPESVPDEPEDAAPSPNSDDFPGWDTMIMALMA